MTRRPGPVAEWRLISWRAPSELAQAIQDAMAILNRPLPPAKRLSFQKIITARMEAYLLELQALAQQAQAKDGD